MPDKSLIDYFIEHTNVRLDKLENSTNTRLDKIQDTVDQIRAFKWQIIGGSIALSGFLAVAINVIMIIVTKGSAK